MDTKTKMTDTKTKSKTTDKEAETEAAVPGTSKSGAKIIHYECQYCRKSCFSEQEVQEHEKTHIENKKLLCRKCGKGFARRSYLAEHMVIHYGQKPHKCEFCSKEFTLLCNKKRHIRIHTGEKPYKCEICQKFFTLKKNMIEHRRTHTGEKPFKCQHCEATFARRSSMVRHARTHTDDKKFECHDCGKTFSWKYYLRRHVARHMNPTRQRVPRKRRTKAEMLRDKAVKEPTPNLNPVVSIVKCGVNIKIEENEDTTTRVFLPTISNHHFVDEGLDPIKEEVQEEPLELTKHSRSLRVSIPMLPNLPEEAQTNKTTLEPVVKIKEEARDDFDVTVQSRVCDVVPQQEHYEMSSIGTVTRDSIHKTVEQNYEENQGLRLIVHIPKVKTPLHSVDP